MSLWSIAAALLGVAICPWTFHYAFLPFLLWHTSGIFWGVGVGVLTGRAWWGALIGLVTMYLIHGLQYGLAFRS